MLSRRAAREVRLAEIRGLEAAWAVLEDRTGAQALEVMARWLREQVTFSGASGCLFAATGGVESALVALLLQRALPDRATGIIMSDAADAVALLDVLGLPYRMCPQDVPMTALLSAMNVEDPDPQVAGNLATRLQYAVLFYEASACGALVVGTGNLDEAFCVGFLSADLYPLAGLHRDEVRVLVRRGLAPFGEALAKSIAERPASPGFWLGDRLEDVVGTSETVLGQALEAIVRHGRVTETGVVLDDSWDGTSPDDLLRVADAVMQRYHTTFQRPALFRPAF